MSPVCSQASRSHGFAAHQDLAVVGDPDLHAHDRAADAVELDLAGAVDADHRAALGQPVTLEQGHAQRREEQGDLVVEGRPARDQSLDPAAEARLHLAPHQTVEQPVGQALAEPERVRPLVRLAAERDRAGEQLRLQPALARHALQDALAHHLVEARHAGDDRRPHLEEVAGEGLEAVGIVDLGADRHRMLP
jgi:hypothetical protein